MTVIAVIPARLQSSRFPGKVLADIHGHPMLWHVYQGVCNSSNIDGVWILSDSQEVLDQARSWGANVLITSDKCESGTDRIASVIDSLDADVVINVQGDEPLISSEVIDALSVALGNDSADIATPVYRISSWEELVNPNVVKVVKGQDGFVIYFSRSPVPHVRGVSEKDWLSYAEFWGHTGVYAYRKETLMDFYNLPGGRLENIEKLEQMRFLEAGKKFIAVEIDYRPLAVDVPDDLEAVKIIMSQSSNTN